MTFDPGPPNQWADFFSEAPLDHYGNHSKKRFRYHFGPVYYRGRLDGSARVLVIGQGPSTNEILCQRAFVGSSGQRVQRLLAKIGITRSYIMANTFLFSVFGQFNAELRRISLEPEILNYRNRLLSKVAAENQIEAVIAFGAAPRHAYENWSGGQQIPAFFLTHPAAQAPVVLANWNQNLAGMAQAIAPDQDGVVDMTPYGKSFTPGDSVAIPRFDLPFGTPDWHGTSAGLSTRDGDNKIIWQSPLV